MKKHQSFFPKALVLIPVLPLFITGFASGDGKTIPGGYEIHQKDTVPKPAPPKKVKATYYSKQSKTVTVVYTNGSKEVITAKAARERKLMPPPPPKMNSSKPKPPTVILKKNETPPEEIRDQEINVIDISEDKSAQIAPPKPDRQYIDKPAEEDRIYTKVDIEASVDSKVWKRHLENQMKSYIQKAKEKNIPPGQYTIQVRFIVYKDGSISDVKGLTDPGDGLREAAIEIIKKGPKWKPAEQNGKKVNSYHTQPITFIINK